MIFGARDQIKIVKSLSFIFILWPCYGLGLLLVWDLVVPSQFPMIDLFFCIKAVPSKTLMFYTCYLWKHR